MATANYSGTGTSIDEAQEALYKSAGTRDVTGVNYSVKIGDVMGEPHKKYEKALAGALKAAGIKTYDPDTHSLEVTAKGEVKVEARASGAGLERCGSIDYLTGDSF